MKLARRMERLGTETTFSVLANGKTFEAQERHHPPGDRRARLRDAPHIAEADCQALREGHTKISRIAFETGFESLSRFYESAAASK